MTKREMNLRIFEKEKTSGVLFQPRIEWWYQYNKDRETILFLPGYPSEELEKCVEKLITLFYPRLILGVSDEVPPPADIERVRIVSEMVNDFNHFERRRIEIQ